MKRAVWLLPVLLLVLSMTAFADTTAPSFTRDVTNIFREDQDRYLDPIYWGELGSGVLFLQLDLPGGDTYFEGGIGLPLGGLYFGLNYRGGNYTDGTLSSNNSIIQTSDTEYTVDGTGAIQTITETDTVQIGYRDVIYNRAELLLGLSLGDITLGIKNTLLVDNDSYYGTYAPSFIMPTAASFSAPEVDTATNTATTVTTREPGGTEPISMISEEYGLGTNEYSVFSDTLTVGVFMPLGNLSLWGDIGFNLYLRDLGESAAFETYSIDTTSGYPSYTPTTALEGNTAVEIADLEQYTYRTATEDTSSTVMIPSLNAGITTPLPFETPVTLEAGVSGELGFYTYKTPYTDLTGTAQTVSGYASDFYETTYTVNETSPDVFETTTTSTRAYQAQEHSYSYWSVEPEVNLIVEPSDIFRFAVGYAPNLTGWSSTSSYTGGAQSVTTYEDGDGVNGNTDGDDPDDYVVTRTVTRNGESSTIKNFVLEHQVSIGTQFYLVPEKLRINLGSFFTNEMINKQTMTETTSGTVEFTETTSTNGAAAVETDYDIDTTPPQEAQYNKISGSLYVDYEAGMTFYFSEDMYLDLKTYGGYLWDLSNWSLEMTIRF
ncbi:MAG: hypothetical protein ACLFST_02005 [Spirochaetia bacterium]